MKTIVCTKYGPPEVLQIKETAKPAPKDNEILIKVFATTVTAADFRVRSFTVPPAFWLPARIMFGLGKPRKPFSVLGTELAGEVEAAGKDVRRFKPGDPVFGTTDSHFGAYAEYVCMPEDGLVETKPANLSYEAAAAIPFGGRASLHFLRKGNVRQGQKILIYGASGCLGTYAVQLAKVFGAEVTGVCSGANLDLVQSLGADRVIDYTKEDFSKSGEIYDVVFDTVGKSSFSACMRSLGKEGTYMNTVVVPLSGHWCRMKWASITTRRKMIGGETGKQMEYLTFLKELVEAGKIKPVIDRCYPFEQIVEAHRYVDKGHKKGSVVVTLAPKN
ncbi:MAG: NAD(P)-dependent alcohol dehydrogenase [Deltaproteobacteria bacterium]|nr:NAD(P)-dependent alcohol dehydrogenase [Deltaproteobacteria bacterium]